MLLDACGADWTSVDLVEHRKGHDRRYSLDITKIGDELGYAPQVPFEAGLADVVDWYRENRAWWKPLKRATPTVVRQASPFKAGDVEATFAKAAATTGIWPTCCPGSVGHSHGWGRKRVTAVVACRSV